MRSSSGGGNHHNCSGDPYDQNSPSPGMKRGRDEDDFDNSDLIQPSAKNSRFDD